MRKTTFAVVISSVILGAVAAQAEPATEGTESESQNQQAQAPQTDTSRPAASSAATDTDTAKGTGNAEVGSARSNVDKPSTSPAYHPYSAGTVGDDPAKPTSTSAPKDARDKSDKSGDEDPQSTDQWGDVDSDGDGYLSHVELTKLDQALSASFNAMDANSDQKLTRAEFRTWHESLKARMGAE